MRGGGAREREGNEGRTDERRERMSSPCRSSKFAAISWPPAGASKTLRRKSPGGRGEPEGRAVPHTHTCSFSTHTLPPSARTHSHTHFLLSSHTQFLLSVFLFLLFSFHRLARCDEGRPPGVCQSGGAYRSRGASLWDSEGHGLGAQSPILHFLSFRRG